MQTYKGCWWEDLPESVRECIVSYTSRAMNQQADPERYLETGFSEMPEMCVVQGILMGIFGYADFIDNVREAFESGMEDLYAEARSKGFRFGAFESLEQYRKQKKLVEKGWRCAFEDTFTVYLQEYCLQENL